MRVLDVFKLFTISSCLICANFEATFSGEDAPRLYVFTSIFFGDNPEIEFTIISSKSLRMMSSNLDCFNLSSIGICFGFFISGIDFSNLSVIG